MGFRDCLVTAVKAKEINQQQADDLAARFDGFSRARGGGAAGDSLAKKLLADELANKAARKKRLAYLSARNLGEIDADLSSFRNAKGKPDIGAAAIRKLEHFGDAQYSSVEGRHKALLGIAQARLEGMLEAFRRHKLLGDNLTTPGVRVAGRDLIKSKTYSFRLNQDRLNRVVDEAFGEQ